MKLQTRLNFDSQTSSSTKRYWSPSEIPRSCKVWVVAEESSNHKIFRITGAPYIYENMRYIFFISRSNSSVTVTGWTFRFSRRRNRWPRCRACSICWIRLKICWETYSRDLAAGGCDGVIPGLGQDLVGLVVRGVFGSPLNGIFASFMAIWEGVPQLNYHDYQPLTSLTRPGMIHPPSGFRWRLAWPILYLQQFVVQPFFGTMFVGFDFLHATMHARKEERNLLGPFYHWSSNHRGKMAKYKSACLLYVFVPCFFQVFHVSQTFSVSLAMVCIFLNGVLRLPLCMLFL